MYTRERETFQYGWFTGYPFSKGSARCELRTPDLLFPFAISNFMKILLFYGTSHRNRQVFARVTACNMKFEDFAWKYLSPVQDFNVFFIRLLVIGKRSRNTGNAFLGFYWKFSLLIEHTLTLEEGHASDMTVVDRMKRADEKSAIFLQVKSILAERLKARADNAKELGGLIATRYPSFFLPLPTLSLSHSLSVCLCYVFTLYHSRGKHCCRDVSILLSFCNEQTLFFLRQVDLVLFRGESGDWCRRR